MKKSTCHPDLPHVARGLCRQCYARSHYLGDVPKRETRMATCHPSKKHYSLGLCESCYKRNDFAKHPEKYANSAQRYYAKHRDEIIARVGRYQSAHPEIQRAAYQKRMATSPEHVRAISRKSKAKNRGHDYGLTRGEVAELRAAQANKCAVCDNAFQRTPDVDHNHTSGKVRGLLCSPCNLYVGRVERALRKSQTPKLTGVHANKAGEYIASDGVGHLWR